MQAHLTIDRIIRTVPKLLRECGHRACIYSAMVGSQKDTGSKVIVLKTNRIIPEIMLI